MPDRTDVVVWVHLHSLLNLGKVSCGSRRWPNLPAVLQEWQLSSSGDLYYLSWPHRTLFQRSADICPQCNVAHASKASSQTRCCFSGFRGTMHAISARRQTELCTAALHPVHRARYDKPGTVFKPNHPRRETITLSAA